MAEQFEANRTHMRAVAYRMLGSPSEADDAVQEAWLRLSRSGTSGVDNLGRWLTTVVARGENHRNRPGRRPRATPPARPRHPQRLTSKRPQITGRYRRVLRQRAKRRDLLSA